jgi:D-sedoheptulose 7-phosphate isomerase
MEDFIKSGLTEAKNTIDSVLTDEALLKSLKESIECLSNCYKNNGRVFSCGNGGSMCDSMHFAEELTGRFRKDRPSLGVMSISDPSHLTCVGNDYGYEHVFSRHLEGWGNEGDVLLAISTSGNSPNILEAVKVAKQKKNESYWSSRKRWRTIKRQS